MFPTQEGPYLRLQRSDVERPNLAWHPWKSHILQSTIPCNLWEGALAPPRNFSQPLHTPTRYDRAAIFCTMTKLDET